MSTTKIDGICALHTIITPNCVRIHGNNGLGAFDEAAKRLREEYKLCLEGWQRQGKIPTFHVVLTVERPVDKKQDGKEGTKTE